MIEDKKYEEIIAEMKINYENVQKTILELMKRIPLDRVTGIVVAYELDFGGIYCSMSGSKKSIVMACQQMNSIITQRLSNEVRCEDESVHNTGR